MKVKTSCNMIDIWRIHRLLMPAFLILPTLVSSSVLLDAIPNDGPKPLVCKRADIEESEEMLSPRMFLSSVITPTPHRTYCVWENGMLCNTDEFERRNGAIYLDQDMDLNEESFSIFAHVRLRPRNNTDNWGGRILSKRTSYRTGWQFVVPSFYSRRISMYMNDDPGHITYGEAVVPDNVWVTVAITVDRDTFRSSNLATVQAYYNGEPDGSPYIVFLNNTLASNAPLTIGHWMYEDMTLHVGRKDWRDPERRTHVHRFFGDIRDLTVWKQPLTPAQLLRYSDRIVAKNGHGIACPPTWRRFACKCYKVFNTPLKFDTAWTKCRAEGGRLVVISTEPVQEFVWSLVVTSSDQDFWIGLNDTIAENRWQFSNGLDLNYFIGQWNNFPKKIPDKEYKTDDCAELRKIYAGKWNDANCNKYNPFICERDSGTECT